MHHNDFHKEHFAALSMEAGPMLPNAEFKCIAMYVEFKCLTIADEVTWLAMW